MKNTDGKKLLDKFIREMAITVRIGIDDCEFTEQEAMQYIGEQGNKMFAEVLNMKKDQFMMLALAEILENVGGVKK